MLIWWMIGGAAVVLFVWQLLRDHLPCPAFLRADGAATATEGGKGGIRDWLTRATVQRRIMYVLMLLALVWPFFGSRGAVDIATLILIYAMLG